MLSECLCANLVSVLLVLLSFSNNTLSLSWVSVTGLNLTVGASFLCSASSVFVTASSAYSNSKVSTASAKIDAGLKILFSILAKYVGANTSLPVLSQNKASLSTAILVFSLPYIET